MIRQLLPPLVALALASAVYVPPTRAQVVAVPATEPVVIDLVEDMLDELRGRAILVGRHENVGYVQTSWTTGYFIRVQPNGQVRISKATGEAILAFANAHGRRL